MFVCFFYIKTKIQEKILQQFRPKFLLKARLKARGHNQGLKALLKPRLKARLKATTHPPSDNRVLEAKTTQMHTEWKSVCLHAFSFLYHTSTDDEKKAIVDEA